MVNVAMQALPINMHTVNVKKGKEQVVRLFFTVFMHHNHTKQ